MFCNLTWRAGSAAVAAIRVLAPHPRKARVVSAGGVDTSTAEPCSVTSVTGRACAAAVSVGVVRAVYTVEAGAIDAPNDSLTTNAVALVTIRTGNALRTTIDQLAVGSTKTWVWITYL